MFANRFTAFMDACALAGALKRNLLLTLAEAEFYRVRWSPIVLKETERAIAKMLIAKQMPDAANRASQAIFKMEAAFEEASVDDFDAYSCVCSGLPDQNDTHVVAAAIKTQASIIVTDNLKHFPEELLLPFGIEVRSTDAFLANTIDLDLGKAVAAIRLMRFRFKKPEKTAGRLLLEMEAQGLTDTVDVLRAHVDNL